ncbi:MAG TPA: Rieske 2Fe-2S domain-containing protein [Pedobacter sp.]|jgi:3-phenylpropionate/trans-cinnamate dioxygenase ferredoxin subunit
MKWHKIFEREILLRPDFIKQINVNGKKFCVVKLGQEVTVTQAYCPHAGAGLSGGTCKNGKLICPFHRYEYDLTTGRGAPGQGDYIEIYPTEIRSDGIYVAFPEAFGFLKRLFK